MPKEQKVEFWKPEFPENKSLTEFIEKNYNEGWFVHQIVPFGHHDIAFYIIFYKY